MEDVYKFSVDDTELMKSLEDIEKQLIQTDKAAENLDKQLNETFNPDFGLGVSDGLNDIKKKYAELQNAARTLRSALRNATDPTAIALYKKGINELEGGMKTLETASKKAGVSLKEVNKEVGTGKQVFREFFGEFTKASIIVYAIQKVVEFTKFAVGLSEQTKLATRQFEAFTGSAEKAGDIVSKLQGFAAEKILDTGEVLQAGKALLAFGENADNLTPVLSRVADISAATGKNFNELVTIYGKARAAGVLYAEDINQLVDAGIPIIQEFARQMGVSNDEVKKLASEGKISFEELQLAFFNLTEEGGKFAGQAELNAETIGGAWRGLVAELQPAIQTVGDFFASVATNSINSLKQFVSDIKEFGPAALYGVTSKDKKEVGAFFDLPVQASKEAEEERRKLEEAAAKRRAELAKQNNKKAAEEAAKRRKQRLEEFNQTLADVDAQAAALDLETTFNPVERVEKENEAALKAAGELQKKLVELATTPEQKAAVDASMARLFEEIKASYEEELSKAGQELEKLKGGKIREALIPLPPANTIDDDLKFRAEGVLKSLSQAADDFIAGQEPRTLAEILGVTDEGLEGLKDAAGQVISSLEQIADARVKEADAAVDAAERKVSAAQDALEREQELAADGLSNDTDLAKKQLDEAKKAQEQAEKDRAKAVRSQILLDSVGQLSSLITASANIFKSLSSIPFAGIPLAIATIGIMFGAFAKAKSDALKAASAPKFRKGGKLEGPAHEYGGIAISDSEGNVYGEAEGGEWIVNKRESQAHDRFLKRLNDGEFAGVNLDRVFKPSVSNPLTDAAPRIARIEKERREMETTMNMEAMAAAYEKTAAQIVQAIKEQPEIYPLTNYKVKRRKGRNTYTEIVRQEG